MKTIDSEVKKALKRKKKITAKDTLTAAEIRRAVKVLEKASVPMQDVWIVTYAWINYDGKIRCAWCKKERSKIRFPYLHIWLHDLKQKLWRTD